MLIIVLVMKNKAVSGVRIVMDVLVDAHLFLEAWLNLPTNYC